MEVSAIFRDIIVDEECHTLDTMENETIQQDCFVNAASNIEMELISNDTSDWNVESTKRLREDSDEEWILTTGKRKKSKDSENIEIYLSSIDKLPRQFTLARLFKEWEIKDIYRVKFISPYKVRVDFSSEASALKFENCHQIRELNWRTQRAMEKKFSYGVIRNVDIDLSDEDILKNVHCLEPAELIAVKRLQRRDFDTDNWSPSEAVRLCFKGAFLPPYVYTHDLRIKVDSYVFPVTQCSRCWKFGHVFKRCPSTKIICPKCGGNHVNCDPKALTCVNCGGNHISLSKICPNYLKEKRLRELMAEFNCTYRKAITIYVPTNYEQCEVENIQPVILDTSSHNINTTPYQCSSNETYATVVSKKKIITDSPKKVSKTPKRQYVINSQLEDNQLQKEIENVGTSINIQQTTQSEHKANRDITFSELLIRLQEILFLRENTMQNKFKEVVKICVEWFISVMVDNISDWPVLGFIISYLSNNG